MMINIFTLINILTAVILLLSGVLAVVVWTQISIFKKYSEIKRNNDHIRTSLANEEGELLNTARQKAEEIISNALKQAANIEKDAQVNQSEYSKLLESRIDKVVGSSSEKLQTALNNIQQDFQKALLKQSDENISRLKAVSKDFENRNVKEIEEELTKSKEDKIKRLEEKIYDIVKNASLEILKGSIDLSSHEELIASAVEKAVKREGL